jgi:hypothetical protein
VTSFLRSPSMFFAVPLLLSIVATLATFDLPSSYYNGLGMLFLLVLLSTCIDRVQGARLPTREDIRSGIDKHPRELQVGLALGWLVLAACVVDLVAFPLPILNPSIYADFGGGRASVRHISNMCWILPVIGVLCVRRPWLRALFIVSALAFPVLVLDRNRLFASVYTVVAVMILSTTRRLPWKGIVFACILLLALFSELGKLRSGNLEWIALPFSELYNSMSPGVKWVLLYVSAGVYNFSAIEAKSYQNDDFLVNQVVPGAGSVETIGTSIPFDEPVINVGTEYFPFLMAFGPIGAVVAGLGLYLALVASVRLFQHHVSLFAFLIFLRLSYVCVMAGFAPQAYTWTNFGFVVLCAGLLVFSSLMRKFNFRAIRAH